MKRLICLFKGHVWSITRYLHSYGTKHCLRCDKCVTKYIDLQKKELFMEKELKDYLHLYLGCEVIYHEEVDEEKELCTLIGISIDGNVKLQNKRGTYYYVERDTIKPTLRPLSDMTEEEARECWELTDSEKQNIDGWQVVDYFRREPNFYEPKTYRHLLFKHFDLFGLIESGLAIDKTTIK